MSTLHADVARCDGVKDEFGWREGCESCLRRACEPTDNPRVVHMQPPDVVVFFCPHHIEGEKEI